MGMSNGANSSMRGSGSGSGSGSPLANASSNGSQIRQIPSNQLRPVQSNTPPIHSSNSPSNMSTPQTVQQPPTPSSQALAQGQGQGQVNQPTWQREFNGIVDLIGAQPNKHYVASPPELEMILARTSAGALPK
jgi:CCR4-NOT transcriptional complex subunit CAF120